MIPAFLARLIRVTRPDMVADELHKMGSRVRSAANDGERSVKMRYLYHPLVVAAFRVHGYTVTETTTKGAETTLIEW